MGTSFPSGVAFRSPSFSRRSLPCPANIFVFGLPHSFLCTLCQLHTISLFSVSAQHKAVIFFFIFTVIFAMMSMVVGACSPCFVPNGVLHVVSVLTASECSCV